MSVLGYSAGQAWKIFSVTLSDVVGGEKKKHTWGRCGASRDAVGVEWLCDNDINGFALRLLKLNSYQGRNLSNIW